MTTTIPDQLDFDVDVLLDDLPDVAGTPREMRERSPAVWAVGMLDIGNLQHDALACSQAFEAFVDPILQQRRTDPGDDLISRLAIAEVDGERLSDEEIFAFLKLLFPAGADTTYLGLGNTLHALLTHPDQLEIVLTDPAEHARWAAEEAIRLDPPVAWIPRINRADITWDGIDIPAGTSMYLGVMAANRDPDVRITGTIHHLLRGPNRLPVTFGSDYCRAIATL